MTDEDVDKVASYYEDNLPKSFSYQDNWISGAKWSRNIQKQKLEKLLKTK